MTKQKENLVFGLCFYIISSKSLKKDLFINVNFYPMITFVKESIREIRHVVWPTKKERNKYLVIVLSVLILFGLYLFLASTIFSEGLFALKNLIN